jgi:hypothetical protein
MTVTEIQTIIDAYMAAELAVLQGKAHTLNGRSVTRENLGDIREGRQEWEQKLLSVKSRNAGANTLYSVADFS